ncbi:MAG TPA: hypothetical protein PLR20_15025 [Syntrophales bacterium]|nr:hypothetical protein [Syntrophales bacterium]HPI58507.1 hypothetical protein [Syntrophales bacterium]HPN26230.1 hypothetical protein [Syntrophales bacterium]HQM30659.1 hypothetical protein [Syntrophales bacterium]
MNSHEKRTKPGIAVILALGFLALTGCAQYQYLKDNPVDPTRVAASDAANKKYNAIRFESFGPYMEQIYGYVLYGEGEILTDGGPVFKEGMMSLNEVLSAYDKMRLSSGWYKASPPIIREVYRNNQVFGYLVSDYMLDVGLWEDLEASKAASRLMLRLYYKDRRVLDRDGGGGFPEGSN